MSLPNVMEISRQF